MFLWYINANAKSCRMTVRLQVQQKSDEGRAQVHISVAEREDTGKYTITVSNEFGVDTGEVSVVVLGKTVDFVCV